MFKLVTTASFMALILLLPALIESAARGWRALRKRMLQITTHDNRSAMTFEVENNPKGRNLQGAHR